MTTANVSLEDIETKLVEGGLYPTLEEIDLFYEYLKQFPKQYHFSYKQFKDWRKNNLFKMQSGYIEQNLDIYAVWAMLIRTNLNPTYKELNEFYRLAKKQHYVTIHQFKMFRKTGQLEPLAETNEEVNNK